MPLWKSAAFWPRLRPDGHHLAPFFMPGNRFQFLMVYFYLADVVATLESRLPVDSLVLACYFDFDVPVRSFNAGFCLYNATGYCNKCALFWPL